MRQTREVAGQEVLFAPEVQAAAVAPRPEIMASPVTAQPMEQPAVSLSSDEYTDPAAFEAEVDRIVDTRSVDYVTARTIAKAALQAPLRPRWMLSPDIARNNKTRAEEARQMLADLGMPPTNHRRNPHAAMPRRRRLHR